MNNIKKMAQENYDALYLMTLSTTLLNSADLGEFRTDAEKIISFIGIAYRLDDNTINSFSELILGDMMKIGLISDYLALSSVENLSEHDLDNLVLYEIKGKALEEVNRSNRKEYFYSNVRQNHNIISGMKYESFHHVYDPVVRFETVKKQASFGDVNSTRELGLMYYLGIGTEKNIEKSKIHLERCVMWGDTPSALFMSIIYKEDDEKESERYGILYRLEKEYLEDGVIIIPCEEKVDKKIRDKYLCIALIKYYLIVQAKISEIDIAFMNVIMQTELSERIILNYISRYKDNIWKNAICGVTEKHRIGL